MHKKKEQPSASHGPSAVGLFCPPWELALRTQRTMLDGEYLDTCLYQIPGCRLMLVQMRCPSPGESWVEMVEIPREDAYQFGRALCMMSRRPGTLIPDLMD